MAEAPDGLDGSDIDPWAVIEELRANPHVRHEEREAIEAAHAVFEGLGSAFVENEPVREAICFAFRYGAIMGSYVATRDPTLFSDISALRGSLAGRRSGQARQDRPWHEPATSMAIKLRQQYPTMSQERVAEKIEVELQKLFPPGKSRVGPDTLKDFVSGLEREGKLPRKRNLGS